MFTLISEFSSSPLEPWLKQHHVGRMWSSMHPKLSWEGELFGIDNGAYSCWRKNRSFEEGQFFRRLEAALELPHQNCIVAVLPDIVCGGLRSLDFSLSYYDKVPPGLPWHLALQDGMTEADVQQHLKKVAGLFLGGSSPFKRTAHAWCKFAKKHGKFFHYARVGSVNRLRDAVAIGSDSCDSSRPVRCAAHGRIPEARQWMRVATGRDNQLTFIERATPPPAE